MNFLISGESLLAGGALLKMSAYLGGYRLTVERKP
jgi:hypothetical protein